MLLQSAGRRYSPNSWETTRDIVDQIFWTDLPTPVERDEILKIHCRKRSVDVTQYSDTEWNKFIDKTTNYVGSELEQIICDARFVAFSARQTGQPTIDELISAAANITPIAISNKDAVDEIRKLGRAKAMPVSKPALQTRSTPHTRTTSI